MQNSWLFQAAHFDVVGKATIKERRGEPCTKHHAKRGASLKTVPKYIRNSDKCVSFSVYSHPHFTWVGYVCVKQNPLPNISLGKKYYESNQSFKYSPLNPSKLFRT